MKVRSFRAYLAGMQDEGYGNYSLCFSDQDCDYYTINEVFADDEDDVCLQEDCGCDMTVDDILDALDDMDDDSYIYFEKLYDDDSNLICDIEGGWYVDDDCDLVMDVVYHYDDDDDDDC